MRATRRLIGCAAALILLSAACSPAVQTDAPDAGNEPAPEAPEPQPQVALQWRQIDAQGPSARRDYSFTGSEDGATAFLFGGRSGSEALADLWRFDVAGGTWEQIQAEGPAPRFGHNAVISSGNLLVFGGQGGPSTFFDDLWLFSSSSGGWEKLESGGGPVARYGAGGTLYEGQLYITHGFTNDGRFDDTWTFTKTWKDVSPDGGRPLKRCLADFAVAGQKLVLFGGQTDGTPYLGDTWVFDPASGTWQEMESEAPSARNLYAMVSHREGLLLFGGRAADGALNDVWWFDDSWKRLEPEGDGPAPRFGVEGAVVDGGVLVFGGKDKEDLSDLWLLTI